MRSKEKRSRRDAETFFGSVHFLHLDLLLSDEVRKVLPTSGNQFVEQLLFHRVLLQNRSEFLDACLRGAAHCNTRSNVLEEKEEEKRMNQWIYKQKAKDRREN